MNSSYSSRLTILFASVFLATFYILGTDRYKDNHKQWQSTLTELRLASYQLDNALFKVRGGLRVDYDQAADAGRRLSKLQAKFKQYRLVGDEVPNSMQAIKKALFADQGHITLATDDAERLISIRLELMEDFKSSFSIMRNAELIAIQLIDDLKTTEKDAVNLLSEVNELERIVLRLVHLPAGISHQEMDNHLASLNSTYRDSNPEIRDFLLFITGHINTIFQKKPQVNSLIDRELELSSQFEDEIDLLSSNLAIIHGRESTRAKRFSLAFSATAVLVLIFGALQASRAYLLTKKIQSHNANLEMQVEQRTAHLESATDDLQREKIEREKVLVQLDESRRKLYTIVNNLDGCIYEYNFLENTTTYVSEGVERIWGVRPDQVIGTDKLGQLILRSDVEGYSKRLKEAIANQTTLNIEYRVYRSDDDIAWVRDISTPVEVDGKLAAMVGVTVDISEFKRAGEEKARIEEELSQAQKLESVGQLAAGIAHEINTPAQFISDNLVFLQDSVGEMLELIRAVESLAGDSQTKLLGDDIDALIKQADMDYLSDEVPSALQQSYEGISRVAKIVRAMKDYSHPGETMEPADINAALESTITVSRSEWKYFAAMDMHLDDKLPLVECVVSDINQVVLNMIVNAAHAIVERFDEPDDMKGKIVVQTQLLDDAICIEIGDNGNGMPEEVKNRVFDQFFTTKEVGKGTGQGLSIARRLVVEKHGGRIEIDSAVGSGTTFRIFLPLKQDRAATDVTTERKIA